MNTLGLRATPHCIFYSVFNVTNKEIIACESFLLPKIYNDVEKLKYLRSTTLDLIALFKVDGAAIRIIENNAQTVDHFRLNIEGVIREAFASKYGLIHDSFVKANFKKIFKVSDLVLKDTIARKSTYLIEDINEFSKSEEVEAILAAMALATKYFASTGDTE